MDAIPLNFNILRHWENWVIITLMLLVSLIALDLLIGAASAKTSTSDMEG